MENEKQTIDFVDPIVREGKEDGQTIFNKISQASIIIRDRRIVCDIYEALEEYKKVFVVYGASHAVMEKPALNKIME